MDFLTRETYNDYVADTVVSQMETESKKYSFQRNLEGEYGKQILKELSDSTNHYELKTTLWYRFKNWVRKKREKRIYRKYSKRENEIAYIGIKQYLKEKGER